jgi:polysaccharide deacetylase family protein (PEP-CTERM system associated)
MKRVATSIEVGAEEKSRPIPETSRTGAVGRRAVTNAMSVDVEDYFQVEAFASVIRREDWGSFACRVERNTDLALRIFDDAGIHATFFVLGWVAERFPTLVRRIVDGGHELASHGSLHQLVFKLQPDDFRRDVRACRHRLEDTGGVGVQGYRAPSFSLRRDTPWAFEILAEEGFAYSSSIFPIRHDVYGWPDAPRRPFRPNERAAVVEIPMSTVRKFGQNLPCSGGGYFRLLPYAWTRWALRQRNVSEGQPAIFYFHPWELDPEQPRIAQVPLRSRLRHYTNLRRTEHRLRDLVREFRWAPIATVFADELSGHVQL